MVSLEDAPLGCIQNAVTQASFRQCYLPLSRLSGKHDAVRRGVRPAALGLEVRLKYCGLAVLSDRHFAGVPAHVPHLQGL
jgi:hypothetical protein